MAVSRKRLIEGRHVVKLQRRLPDVRPWHDKFAEACTQKPLVMVLVFPLIVFSAVFWLIAPITLGVAWWILTLHKMTVPVLPMRYPAINKEPNPVDGKKGKGIMLFGHQESTSSFEKFKEIWSSDDDLRKHVVILGSTGSGKSETLKALFFNALCWSSGFFIADGKADNKLPTDIHTMVRSVGMDDNMLHLNFLLGGKTPEQVRKSRRRRTNKLNFVGSTDADTLIQIGSNMLPKVEGEGKNWQEKALNFWRAVVTALCYKRDTQGFEISVTTLVEYMALSKVEELYLEGFREAQELGEWSHGFASIKNYLDSGCPAYKVEKLLAKHGLDGGGAPAAGGGRTAAAKPGANDQDPMASEQHAYRTSQLMPVLNLLDKTYGHIFRDKFPEIDMVDVTLNNRIMTLLIPSLEKSAAEAENLGKLAIACLRVMMARNLGGGIEGTRRELLDAKATTAPYPYLVALDELGYYFSDGLAVIFAQARSLGFCMIPAAQDLEKLTEGNRAAEAGAMLANAGIKAFLRIDDAKKTWEFISNVLGKVSVPMYQSFKIGGFGWKRNSDVSVQETDLVKMADMQAMEAGEGVINALGQSTWFRSYYMGKDLEHHQALEFYVLRFLQCRGPTPEELDATSIPFDAINDPMVKGERLRSLLSGDIELSEAGPMPPSDVIDAVAHAAQSMGSHVPAHLRAMALFEAARQALRARPRHDATDNVFESDDDDEASAMRGASSGMVAQALPAPGRAQSGEHGLWAGNEPWQGRRDGAASDGSRVMTASDASDAFDESLPEQTLRAMPAPAADPAARRGKATQSVDAEPAFGAAAQENFNDMLLAAAHLVQAETGQPAGMEAQASMATGAPDRVEQADDVDSGRWLDALDQGSLLPSHPGVSHAADVSARQEATDPDAGRLAEQSPAAALAQIDSIALDDLLDASDPVVRKPVQEIGSGPASLDDAVSTILGSLVDPVDMFLGTAVHFSMPALDAPSPASGGAGHARTALGAAMSGTGKASGAMDPSDIQFAWELDDLLDAAGVSAPGPAAAASGSTQQAKTAVGLSASTLQQVTAIERALGNPNAERAAQRVETLVAAQMSQPLAAAVPVVASEAEDMLRELRELEALGREDDDATGASSST